MIEAEKITILNNDWITIVFFIILSVLTAEKFLFSNKLIITSTIFFKKNNLFLLFNREKNAVFNLFQVLFYVVQILTSSLLFFYVVQYFHVKTNYYGLKLYLILAVGISLYFLFRFMFGSFLAFIFDIKRGHKKITFEKINYLNNATLWILPFLLLSSYSSFRPSLILNITLVLFGTLLIIRYIFLIRNNKNLIINNLFYFILYLCALEISPFVIILKLTI